MRRRSHVKKKARVHSHLFMAVDWHVHVHNYPVMLEVPNVYLIDKPLLDQFQHDLDFFFLGLPRAMRARATHDADDFTLGCVAP